MLQTTGKCGCDCLYCPTFKDNIQTLEDRRNCSLGWSKFLNIKLSPEKLRACDGCSLPDRERKTYYLNCRIRKCAMINGVANCAYCTVFPCNELAKVHSMQAVSSPDEYFQMSGIRISTDDYFRFIDPYAGLSHLWKIRNNLTENDLMPFKKHSSKTGFAELPGSLARQKSILKIHELLTTLYIGKDIPYVRLLSLEQKREQLLKILWTAGCMGEHNKENGYLKLDSKTFTENKLTAMHGALTELLEELLKYGIKGEVIPLGSKGWLTPTGGLRKDGWILRLKFGNSPEEIETCAAFTAYIHKLSTLLGDHAFSRFKKVIFP